jgi:hypothetical protein
VSISLTAKINKINFYSPESGWAILNMQALEPAEGVAQGQMFKAVGEMKKPVIGMKLAISGDWETHAKFGKQLKFDKAKHEEGRESAPLQLLGLCPQLQMDDAMRLVKTFGPDVLRIALTNPESLKSHLKWFQYDSLTRVAKAVANEQDNVDFLMELGVPTALIRKASLYHGAGVLHEARANIYTFCNIGACKFEEVDLFAHKAGYAKNAPLRVQAAVLEVLNGMLGDGHLFATMTELLHGVSALDTTITTLVETALNALVAEGGVIEDQGVFYLPEPHDWETDAADRLTQMLQAPVKPLTMPDDLVPSDITLAPEQEDALKQALTSSVLVITGGPGTGKCVGAGSLVLCEKGLVPIETLMPGDVPGDTAADLNISVETLGGPAPSQAFYNGGVKSTRTIETKRGYTLCGTEAHPILVASDAGPVWKPLTDVVPGDYVALSVARTTLEIPNKINEEKAWLLGALMADACLLYGQITYTKNAATLRLQVATLAKSQLDVDSRETTDLRTGVMGLAFYGMKPHLLALGVSLCHSRDKRIPTSVLQSGPEIWGAYLKGLFEHDGHCGKDFEWSTASKQHAREVHIMLTALGIWATLSIKTVNDTPYWKILVTGKDQSRLKADIMGVMVDELKSWNTNVDLTPKSGALIRSVFTSAGPRTRSEWYKWKREIKGERQPSRERVQLLLAERPESPEAKALSHMAQDNIRWDIVETNLDSGPKQVYDLSVPAGGACFVADAFHVHNTFITKTLVKIIKANKRSFKLMAPTGKAAARIKEVTGEDACTLHLGLLAKQNVEGDWGVNPSNTLGEDIILVDEFSMVDSQVFYRLMRGLKSGKRLILVGDTDQLPSVGPGRVFHEVINSGQVPVVRLKTIFRQAAESYIIRNSHHVNNGEPLETSPDSDFIFALESDPDTLQRKVVILAKKMQGKDGIVLTPTNLGPLGVDALNKRLQEELNGGSAVLASHYSTQYRVLDRLIISKNNYTLNVLNGEMGTAIAYDKTHDSLLVRMDSGEDVLIPPGFFEHVKLGYAITVHKAQGSQFDFVIMVILNAFTRLLYRSLLYTAVSRAKKKFVMLGEQTAVGKALHTQKSVNRNTNLAKLLA